jgi:hypothetical protein
MRHSRSEVIERTIREYELLDHIVAYLTNEDWERLLPRPGSKEPWTVKDALAHITHWKADVARSIRRQHRPPEERGLSENEENHQIYMRWRERSPEEVLTWHRQVQVDVLAVLRKAPEDWFSGREHRQEWSYDLDGHSTYHRVKDIERALASRTDS